MGGRRGEPEIAPLAAPHVDAARAQLAGELAGTAATGALLCLVVEPRARRAGVGRALLDAAVARLRDGATRLVVAEVPDDDSHAAMLALLAAAGFAREGVVPDFYRDGVALTLWTRRLA